MRRLASLSRLLCRVTAAEERRGLASLPEKAVDEGTGEVLALAGKAPMLIKLPQRPWGAAASLPQSMVSAVTGGAKPDRLGVVRHAFTPHDEEPEPLSASVGTLPDGMVVVGSRASDPASRLIVDEYKLHPETSEYRLQRVGTDLFRLLKREGVGVAHVPDLQLAALGAFNSVRARGRGVRQSTNEVLMVAPTAFGFNQQAAQDNHFMHSSAKGVPDAEGVTRRVLREFAGLHHELSEVAGVHVTLFQHNHAHGTPDAVFPNNWFSTHPAGEAAGGVKESTLVFYPLKCPNRRLERRPDTREVLSSRGYGRVLDLGPAEHGGQFFEGTGVLVLDRINGVAYVALSERACADMAQRWAEELGYKEVVTFRSTDKEGFPVYHTNVMMAIGTDVAVVCLESVEDPAERKHLLSRLQKHHEVVDISSAQMEALCGNVLELEDGRGLPVMAMSSRAFNAFTPEQKAVMRRHVAALHHAPVDTLEFIGGGGVRCTLGELF